MTFLLIYLVIGSIIGFYARLHCIWDTGEALFVTFTWPIVIIMALINKDNV